MQPSTRSILLLNMTNTYKASNEIYAVSFSKDKFFPKFLTVILMSPLHFFLKETARNETTSDPDMPLLCTDCHTDNIPGWYFCERLKTLSGHCSFDSLFCLGVIHVDGCRRIQSVFELCEDC